MKRQPFAKQSNELASTRCFLNSILLKTNKNLAAQTKTSNEGVSVF